MEGVRASWIFIMTSPADWLWYGGHTQVKLSGQQELGREEGGSKHIAHIRDIKESAGSRQLDRWRCPLSISSIVVSLWLAGCLAKSTLIGWREYYGGGGVGVDRHLCGAQQTLTANGAGPTLKQHRVKASCVLGELSALWYTRAVCVWLEQAVHSALCTQYPEKLFFSVQRAHWMFANYRKKHVYFRIIISLTPHTGISVCTHGDWPDLSAVTRLPGVF